MYYTLNFNFPELQIFKVKCLINVLQSSEFTGLFVILSTSLKISGESVSSSSDNPGSDIIL